MPKPANDTAAELLQHLDQCAAAANELASHPSGNDRAIADLRVKLGEELASLVAESASLQTKAKRKFGPACHDDRGVWWVTRRSLQQATPWQVAQLKANWLGTETVHDLCCAVGGDSISFARRGHTVAVDRDPILVAMARANLGTAIPDQAWEVRCDDILRCNLPDQATIHIDPDRRNAPPSSTTMRTTHADGFSPTWNQLTSLIDRSVSAIIKLAPATVLDWQPADRPTHRCWISLQGTVREQSLLVGDAVDQAGLTGHERSAVRLAADGTWHRFAPVVLNNQSAPTSPKPQVWLIDPVSSIRAAGLTESFAAEYSLEAMGGASGFLTSDAEKLPEDVRRMATFGKVIWTGSAADRKLRRELRAHRWFPETVKCRGVDRDPAALFKRYRDGGEHPVTLWIGRIGKKVYAAITQREST
jgi:hypothetical protein